MTGMKLAKIHQGVAPNQMPKLLCMQTSRLFPQAHDTQHSAHIILIRDLDDKFLKMLENYPNINLDWQREYLVKIMEIWNMT